jgi:hypothetical protein
MHDCGLYSIEEMRPVNELRMKARCKFGGALAVVERGRGARTDITLGTPRPKSYFKEFIRQLDLSRKSAKQAQRLGAMPDDELAKACEVARAEGHLLHYGELDRVAP